MKARKIPARAKSASLEELLAAIAACSDEEKAQILKMLEGKGAVETDDEDEDPAARRAANTLRTAWAKLKPAQRADLKRSAPKAWLALVSSHIIIARDLNAARIYGLEHLLRAPKAKSVKEQSAEKLWALMQPAEKAQLKAQNPTQYAALRSLAGVK